MDSQEGRYGWGADDPRWTDEAAGGRGRLEPSAPSWGSVPRGDPPAPSAAPWPGYGSVNDHPVPPPADVPFWPPPPAAWSTPDAPPAEPPAPLFGPPLAIGATAEPAIQTRYPEPRQHDGEPQPTAGVQQGYSVRAAAALPTAGAVSTAVPPRESNTTRLDRRVRARTRRRSDDEFRRAGRAELFSDDARYPVLFALTGACYVPIGLIFVAWLMAAGSHASGGRVVAGLVWLLAALGLSIAIAALLRWATVGWRAVTLSIAAAIIGGAVASIAHALAS